MRAMAGRTGMARSHILIMVFVFVAILLFLYNSDTFRSWMCDLRLQATQRELRRKALMIGGPKLNRSGLPERGRLPPRPLKEIPLDYSNAKEYFERRGFQRCLSKSVIQAEKNLWMHLRVPSDQTCEKSFADFLATSKGSVEWPPPRQIPANLADSYLMNGRVRQGGWYFAQKYEGEVTPYAWTPQFVGEYIKQANASANFHYGGDTQMLYKVVQDYKLHNLTGMVIGSEVPWVEAILLARAKAKKLLTLEYHPINSTHPQIDYAHPIKFSETWQSYAAKNYDFAFTYSSLEHAGLGRYGDRLDPDGDLKEMQKLSCVLPEGALVFLGLPVGADEVVWNAHRIYGRWRLPLMTANFDVLALYTFDKIANAFDFIGSAGYKHAIVVMKNAKSDIAC